MAAPFEGEKAYKGEKLKEWKGEKMAAPFKGEKAYKGERVKGWKGEKMAAPPVLLTR